MNEINLRNYAYLGDAVWELYIRSRTITATNNSRKLHDLTTSLVNTQYQCELLHNIQDLLSEEEKDIVKRARNLPIPVGRRNIQSDYRQATAFEALIGWWYLNDKTRCDYILNILEKFMDNKNH